MISRSGSLLSLVLVLLLVQAARADVITFANGNKIEGDIVSEDEEGVEIKLANGSTTIPHSQIAKIERKPSPEKEYQKRKDALKATDADGRVELAKFVHEKHLPQPRIPALLSEAFKIDPSCQGAIDMLVKLDYHFESGAWVAPETWYPAHDFVRKDNKWMTLEELDRIAAHDAIAAARKAGSLSSRTRRPCRPRSRT